MPLPISVADNAAAAFHPLTGGVPLLRVVRSLCDAIDDSGRIVVAAAEPIAGDVADRLASHDLAAVPVVAVAGRATRARCIEAALDYLAQATFSTRHVLLHDISQPLTSVRLCERVAAGLRNGSTVVVPALAVTDSIKAVDARGSVTATLDRSTLRVVQYPRGVSVDELSQLLAQRTAGEFDELAEAVRTGVSVTVVEGDPDALRVDLPADADFVEAVILSRPNHSHGR